jgi:phage repressor protein C with HTH and peptisase S24 domain
MIQAAKSTKNEASKNLLLKILKSAGLSKVQCGLYLEKKHSLDHYLYNYLEPNFPASFSYFFLNSVASSKPLSFDNKNKSKKYAHVEDLKNAEKNSFHKILEKFEDLDIKNKLILPALEYHCTILIRLSNSKFIHDEESYLQEYIDEVLPGVREYLEEYDSWEPDENDSINGIVRSSVTEAIKTVNSRLLIEAIENFYPHLEILRKEYMPNFIAPNETFKLPVVNSDEKILFSKNFVKRNLNLNKYNDLVLMNITEDNMQGTINVGDLALIIKFQNKENPILNNGIFAINLNGRLCIRRLQFLKLKQRTLVHIISDNKKYRDDAVAIDELEIYGEVVWKSNSFKDIDFIKHESEEPNLFLPDDDYEIPSFLNHNKKETA